MSKRKLSLVSTAFLSLALMGTVVAYSSTNSVQSTEYFKLTGTHNNYSYTLKVTGNTISVNGSTQYSKSNCGRSVGILGAYISPAFLGYQTKSSNMGGGSGEVSANVSVTDTIYERFISAYTEHVLDGWQYDQTCGVY
ncbi:MAG: hypothetical protein K5865_08185 [Eubacterium sp.]|nr:hypothetical protein [Eubacterium sp.]